MNLEILSFLREENYLIQENIGTIVDTKKFSINKCKKGKETIS